MHFRVDDALRARIEQQAAELGVSRASFIRMLVQQGMGDPVQQTVLREAYYRLQPVLKRVLYQAITQVNEMVPALVDEELKRESGD